MDGHLIIVEGYDGSGKSSLVDGLRRSLGPQTDVRSIGRKDEPRLKPISELIEDEHSQLERDTEMLLRIALETQRQHLVRRALQVSGVVILDRGMLSLRAWLDYYDIPHGAFEELLNKLQNSVFDANYVFCQADFETCWSRVENAERRGSKKERLGKDRNRTFYDQYNAVVSDFIKRG